MVPLSQSIDNTAIRMRVLYLIQKILKISDTDVVIYNKLLYKNINYIINKVKKIIIFY
jgi:predicted transcriptional regulator